MTQETRESLIPPSFHARADFFSRKVCGLLDGEPKDEATVREALAGMEDMFEVIAAGLYSLASMLIGEGEQSVALVEDAIATAELPGSDSASRSRRAGRMALCREAIRILAARSAESLAVPAGLERARPCIDDDDLDSVGVSGEELMELIAGRERESVRAWLASLPTPLRVVFAMRAVAGFTSAETAGMLAASGGPAAGGWTPDLVREGYRQALCSLASQLIHATTAR